jgi:hypothetical protein
MNPDHTATLDFALEVFQAMRGVRDERRELTDQGLVVDSNHGISSGASPVTPAEGVGNIDDEETYPQNEEEAYPQILRLAGSGSNSSVGKGLPGDRGCPACGKVVLASDDDNAIYIIDARSRYWCESCVTDALANIRRRVDEREGNDPCLSGCRP